MRTGLLRPPDDRLDVLDLARLVENVTDRDEQRPLVDRIDDRLAVLADDDLEIRLRLVEVADGGEVAALVHDAIPPRVDGKKHERTTASATATFWCMTVEPAGPPTMRPTWSPTLTGMSHHPSPHERIPRSFHMRAYSTRRSSARRGMAASEWLMRYVVSARIGNSER